MSYEKLKKKNRRDENVTRSLNVILLQYILNPFQIHMLHPTIEIRKIITLYRWAKISKDTTDTEIFTSIIFFHQLILLVYIQNGHNDIRL